MVFTDSLEILLGIFSIRYEVLSQCLKCVCLVNQALFETVFSGAYVLCMTLREGPEVLIGFTAKASFMSCFHSPQIDFQIFS